MSITQVHDLNRNFPFDDYLTSKAQSNGANLTLQLPESVGGVRSIYPQRPGRNDGNIYVGTTRNNILEGSLQRRFNQVVFGHGRQLWGLAVHPDDEVFATAGHDKNIALWRRHKLLWTTQVNFIKILICVK